MDTNPIDKELATLRDQINGRASLLQKYTTITNQLAALPKGKENYDAILVLNEQQQDLLLKLKENKKLRETYLTKIAEKAEWLKKKDRVLEEKLTKLETAILKKETVRIRISESVMAVTELLNEIGKLNHTGGKTKVGIVGLLMGKLQRAPNKHAQLQETKTIAANLRKLAKRYKKELKNIATTDLPDLPVHGFLEMVDLFLGEKITETMMDFKVGSLLKKSRFYEKELLGQLEQLETEETNLEITLKRLQQSRIEYIEKA